MYTSLRDLLILVAIGTTSLLISNARGYGNCSIPSEWWDSSWYIKEFHEYSVKISNNSIGFSGSHHGNLQHSDFFGKCLDRDGQFYIFQAPSGCKRCVVLHMRHENILSYFESHCLTSEDNNKLSARDFCNKHPWNFHELRFIFRSNFKSSSCNLPEKEMHFTYKTQGSPSCANPGNRLRSCLTPNNFVMQYEACHDQVSSQLKREELECLGSYTEGNFRYFVAQVKRSLGSSDRMSFVEGRYRCFIRPKNDQRDVLPVGMSGYASCAGLQNIEEAGSIFKFSLDAKSHDEKCAFPKWFTSKIWHTLDSKITIRVNSKNPQLAVINSSSSSFPSYSKFQCVSSSDNSQETVTILANLLVKCKTQSSCITISRKSSHIAVIKLLMKSERYTEDEFASNCLNSTNDLSINDDIDKSSEAVLTTGEHSIANCPMPRPASYAIDKNFQKSELDDCETPNSFSLGCDALPFAVITKIKSERCSVVGNSSSDFDHEEDLTCFGYWKEGGNMNVVTSGLKSKYLIKYDYEGDASEISLIRSANEINCTCFPQNTLNFRIQEIEAVCGSQTQNKVVAQDGVENGSVRIWTPGIHNLIVMLTVVISNFP